MSAAACQFSEGRVSKRTLCQALIVTSNPGSAWAKWFRRPEFPAKIASAGRTQTNWRAARK
jgi:hypothetical protein